nr:hypothetical protein [Tanacetum cinerariifolium]
MSTQQDIYAAGSKNRLLMLNKENYVPWSSRLFRYAKSRTNGKLIYNFIINGPYVRRMNSEPGDQNREVPVNETFHEQINDELTKKKLKQVEADDQAIQNILFCLSEDIYAAVDSNGGNQFRQYAGQNVRNQNGYNALQNVRNQNPNRNGNVVATQAKGNAVGNNGIQLQAKEFDLMAAVADLDEIEEVNANCILMANLQQASTSDTQTDKAPVYDLDGPVEVHHYEKCYNNDIFNMFTREEQYTELLEPILEPHQVQQNDSNVISKVSSVEQGGGTIDQNPATVEETRAYFESLYNNLAIEVEKVNT